MPPDDFTLLPGHVVEIHVPGIGTLTNPVVLATADLPSGPTWAASVALVTGALGCIGAWTAKAAVLDDGVDVVGYDLSVETRSRLGSCSARTPARVDDRHRATSPTLAAVERSLDDHEVTRVVHLAALQVPFCRANPPLGMHGQRGRHRDRVRGARARLDRIPGRRVRVLGGRLRPRPTPPPRRSTGGSRRGTLYGVYKLANEGIARVYRADAGVPSIGLRPYVVYGPGRDQGMTSGPTGRWLAAVRGEPFEIGFSGAAQYGLRRGRRRRVRPREAARQPRRPSSATSRGARDVDGIVAAIVERRPRGRRDDHRGGRPASRSRPSSSRSASSATLGPLPRTRSPTACRARPSQHFRDRLGVDRLRRSHGSASASAKH